MLTFFTVRRECSRRYRWCRGSRRGPSSAGRPRTWGCRPSGCTCRSRRSKVSPSPAVWCAFWWWIQTGMQSDHLVQGTYDLQIVGKSDCWIVVIWSGVLTCCARCRAGLTLRLSRRWWAPCLGTCQWSCAIPPGVALSQRKIELSLCHSAR